MVSAIIGGVDKDGRFYPLGVKYDYETELASIATSRGAGKNTFSAEYGASYVDEAILAPSAGKKLQIVGILTAMDADTGDIKLDFATSGQKVWRHYGAKFKTQAGMDMAFTGEEDEALTLNCDQGDHNIFVLINYRVVD